VKIELPPGTPLWVIMLALVTFALPTVVFFGLRTINRIFPESERMTWWREYWKQRAAAKNARRRWRADVRRVRHERRAARRLSR
jgi:hypothetical protein